MGSVGFLVPWRSGGRSHKLLSLPLFNGKGAHRTLAQTGTQAVAVLFRQKLRLAIHDDDGPLSAGGDAQTAAIALFLVNFDDLPFGHDFLPDWVFIINLMHPWRIALI
jgi:hypothetical protein